MKTKALRLKIKGMTCEHCALTIEKALMIKGVIERKIYFSENGGKVIIDPNQISEAELVQTINGLGQYRVESIQEEEFAKSSGDHVVIIGGGSAAFAAALQAHELGARVTMIHDDSLPIGGTCVNVGCVPSKNLIRAAESLHHAQINRFPGIKTNGALEDFKEVIRQKRELVETLRQEKYINVIQPIDRFRRVEGFARFLDDHTVEVNGEKITGDYFLIATGSSPFIPSIPGLQDIDYLTNESLFELEEIPQKLIILGGNYIGLEIAQTFARFGSKVTVIELMPSILPHEDPDIVEEIQSLLEKEGIQFITGAETQHISKKGPEIFLKVKTENKILSVSGSHLLVATGRKANTKNMNLEDIGVELDSKGFLKVNDYLQTSKPHIFGAGDVIGGWMFVYTAAYESKLAMQNALTDDKKSRDYTALPWVIFTDPQIAGVGMNEKEAQKSGLEIEVAKLDMIHVPRAIAARDTRGFIKLIRDRKTDRLLGTRIVAPEGSELLMEIALAIKYGITVSELKEMFHPYLTLSEAIKLAAITFSKSVEELSCCAT